MASEIKAAAESQCADAVSAKSARTDKVVKLLRAARSSVGIRAQRVGAARAGQPSSCRPNPIRTSGIINAKIKRRESFRPFAPSVLAGKRGEYFEQSVASPFMMHVVKSGRNASENSRRGARGGRHGPAPDGGPDEKSAFITI